MGFHRLTPLRTPATASEMFEALKSAWSFAFPEEIPKRESLLVLLAQWAIETGRGKSMWNYNIGNIKSVEGDGHDYVFRACDEHLPIARAKEMVAYGAGLVKIAWEHPDQGLAAVIISPDHPGCRFRAFGSLAEGAVDYLLFLHRRFSSSWIAVEAGDPGLFAHLLKVHGYYTGPEDNGHGGGYAPNLRYLFREFSHLGNSEIDLETLVGVQAALDRLGYAPGPVDGVDGAKTRLAVVAFQRKLGLVQDGVVGPATRSALAQALGETLA